jgi:electron transport complex protein RnfB
MDDSRVDAAGPRAPTAGEAPDASRRELLRSAGRGALLLGFGYLAGWLGGRHSSRRQVWQIDPSICTACDRCAKNCVLELSAVKCVHSFPMCGYCDLCTGYFEPAPGTLDTGAENQLCPTGAIIRTFIEDPYFQYEIREELCIGCAKCVKGCNAFGNGSLHMQVRHDRCLNCNECAISMVCPVDAFRRVPADSPYLLKGVPRET